MTGLLGFLQLFPQTLDFGIGFFQFSLFLPQLLTQNFVLLFQFLDSSEGVSGFGPAIPNYVNPRSRICPVDSVQVPLINYRFA